MKMMTMEKERLVTMEILLTVKGDSERITPRIPEEDFLTEIKNRQDNT